MPILQTTHYSTTTLPHPPILHPLTLPVTHLAVACHFLPPLQIPRVRREGEVIVRGEQRERDDEQGGKDVGGERGDTERGGHVGGEREREENKGGERQVEETSRRGIRGWRLGEGQVDTWWWPRRF